MGHYQKLTRPWVIVFTRNKVWYTTIFFTTRLLNSLLGVAPLKFCVRLDKSSFYDRPFLNNRVEFELSLIINWSYSCFISSVTGGPASCVHLCCQPLSTSRHLVPVNQSPCPEQPGKPGSPVVSEQVRLNIRVGRQLVCCPRQIVRVRKVHQ